MFYVSSMFLISFHFTDVLVIRNKCVAKDQILHLCVEIKGFVRENPQLVRFLNLS